MLVDALVVIAWRKILHSRGVDDPSGYPIYEEVCLVLVSTAISIILGIFLIRVAKMVLHLLFLVLFLTSFNTFSRSFRWF